MRLLGDMAFCGSLVGHNYVLVEPIPAFFPISSKDDGDYGGPNSMKTKGVCYDVGVVMGMNWRPHFDPVEVRRELEIIQKDLHCNAVRICGRDVRRLVTAAESGLNLGLEVWLSPTLWNHTAEQTAAYMARAAAVIEPLRQRWPEKLVLFVGSEITLFSQGIVPGRSFSARMNSQSLIPLVKSGQHNAPLNTFLARLVAAVRKSYRGMIAYASLTWEGVDWTPFDFVGVDHYRNAKIEDRYLDMLLPSFQHGKPVVITEFGYATTEGGPMSEGFLGTAGLKAPIIDIRSQVLHQLPLLGRLVRPHLLGQHVRNEAWQARKLVEQLGILEKAGVEGAFVSQFISQITPYNPDPRHDLDMASSSLVKYYEHGRGTTYPDMPWEPKEAFWALSKFYETH
jgi:hypothetical protein